MNQLSWLLYIGDVLGNIGPTFVILSFLSAIGVIFYVVAYCTTGDNLSNYEWDKDKTARLTKDRRVAKGYATLCLSLMFVFALIATFCPSKDTVYAIAASQVGEQILKTPLANKAEKALEGWLDKQIKVDEK